MQNNLLLIGLILWLSSFVLGAVIPPDRFFLACTGLMRLVGFALIIVGIIRALIRKKK